MVVIKDLNNQTIYETEDETYQKVFLHKIADGSLKVRTATLKKDSSFSKGYIVSGTYKFPLDYMTIYIWDGFQILVD